MGRPLRERTTLLKRHLFLVAALAVALCSVLPAAPGVVAAQSTDGVEVTFYGYFSPDVSTVLTLGHLTADNPALAAELVSPRYADDFFEGYTVFTDHEFAADLAPEYIDQIDEADEYMVFKGMYDSVDGIAPGYLTFLSTAQQVFIVVAYQSDADDLFSLAVQVIAEGSVPETYADYTRIELTDAGDASNADLLAPDDPAGEGSEFCYDEPAFEAFDEDGDGLLTITELEVWVLFVPEIEAMIATMEANGYDRIRYADC